METPPSAARPVPGFRRTMRCWWSFTAPTGQGLGQLKYPLADLGVGDVVIGPDELQGLASGQRVGIERGGVGWCHALAAGGRNLIGHVIEEIGRLHVEEEGKFIQAGTADAIGTAFVFLDLLECQANRIAKFFLADAEQGPAKSQAGADMDVDGAGDAEQGVFLV